MATRVIEGCDVTYVLEPSDKLHVLSVCTDRNHPGLVNFRVSLERLGYRYTILGLGEKWQGWKWRTAQYIAALEKMSEENIVTLTDCTDVLFVEPPDELARRFRALNVGVVVGAESDMSTGKFRYHLSVRKQVRQRYVMREPNKRYKFPNGGLLIGYRTPLLRLLYANKDAEDDQVGWVEMYDENQHRFYLDSTTKLFGNVVQRAPFFEEDKEVYEMDKWRVIWSLDVNKNENSKKNENGKRKVTVMNLDTNNSPCVLHFAGGNIDGYNDIGSVLLGVIHQPLDDGGVKQVVKKPWTSTLTWLLKH